MVSWSVLADATSSLPQPTGSSRCPDISPSRSEVFSYTRPRVTGRVSSTASCSPASFAENVSFASATKPAVAEKRTGAEPWLGTWTVALVVASFTPSACASPVTAPAALV